jgi:hypothetical protein
MDFYNETPRGYVKMGDPDSPTELDDFDSFEDSFDMGQGDVDSMMGCVGD